MRWATTTHDLPSGLLNRFLPSCMLMGLASFNLTPANRSYLSRAQTDLRTRPNAAMPRGFTHHPPFSIIYCLYLPANHLCYGRVVGLRGFPGER